MKNPQKAQTLHIETLNDELSVYDWQRLQMHSLNPTAAKVFELCDGQTSPAQMAKRLEAPEAVVWQSLDELGNAHLLSDVPEKPAQYQSMTRQQFLKLGGAVALASIVSIVVPRPAAAQTGGAAPAAAAQTGGAGGGGGGGGAAPTAIVMYNAGTRDGNLGGRAGADTLCQGSANRPAGYANARAFISVAANDAIADMPGNYGVPTVGAIAGPTGTLIANSWADLLDGSISASLNAAGISSGATRWWSGSNADGSLQLANCLNWTTNAGGQLGSAGNPGNTDNDWISDGSWACSVATRDLICIAY